MDPLVCTKFHPSQARPRTVARPRLVARLDPDPGRRLTLVAAPAGFGKSTLLGQWWQGRARGGRRAAWLTLDGGDNDPGRFLAYVVVALRKAIGEEDEGFGASILAALGSAAPPRTDALPGVLVNELAALPGGLDLVLDDYHAIDSGEVHRIVTRLLDRLPEGVHLVVAGRADPPLHLAKLRARGQLVRLGAADLAFTDEESRAFLQGVMGLDLSAGDVASLAGRTEGWIAGLQLAALSMQGRGDLHAFVASFSGTHRDVLDFLADEVLGCQPDHVRDFLLDTSILSELTGPLCDAITGRADGGAMLELLDRQNLFVVALDEERRWYRYHHLLGDFLRDRLGRDRPERARGLHLAAAAWDERHGRMSSAIAHALRAPDHGLAARLIEGGVEGAVERGEGATALRWLEALPTEAKRRHPRLFAQHAVALVLTGRPDDVDPHLAEAGRAAQVDGADRQFLLGTAAVVRSWRARLRGDASEAVGLARRALALLPGEEASIRSFAAVCLGDALRTTGDLAAAGEAFAAAAAIGRDAGHAYARLAGMAMHARVRAEQGRLGEADQAFRLALRLLTEGGFGLLPAAGVVRVGLADLHYERDDLDAAECELARGVELAERTGEVSALVWAYVTLSRTRRARGDGKGALEIARRAEDAARDSGADLQIAIATSWVARLRLMRGELAQAAALERERAANADGTSFAARRVDRMTSARLLHAQGRHREALGLLRELREAAEAEGRVRDLVEASTLRALALWASDERERAVAALAEALALAAPEGYVRTFVDEGPALLALLPGMIEGRRGEPGRPSRRFAARYPTKLLVALERDRARAATSAAGPPELLSERELEVLRLIATGKSNRRIAEDLFVTMGTVKTHANNLYRKLEAHSRTQAVAKARESGLL